MLRPPLLVSWSCQAAPTGLRRAGPAPARRRTARSARVRSLPGTCFRITDGYGGATAAEDRSMERCRGARRTARMGSPSGSHRCSNSGRSVGETSGERRMRASRRGAGRTGPVSPPRPVPGTAGPARGRPGAGPDPAAHRDTPGTPAHGPAGTRATRAWLGPAGRRPASTPYVSACHGNHRPAREAVPSTRRRHGGRRKLGEEDGRGKAALHGAPGLRALHAVEVRPGTDRGAARAEGRDGHRPQDST
ncbi:PE-PGRS family protein [Thermobispora bispora DSM 43833]|uniref:PE-PGRS family protein n=1 Tax=Thermobispora bispora (strain ATCC 19993 / DSM 43833 / CBS 139.67 / JCM 10125 / KCTC 9307 / NBRC 14880 / R51) TaxID=469371 RepID=D6YBD1_THEBD|nr:PE-PGRS family protein [Thermobispora bispora DSM 43833]